METSHKDTLSLLEKKSGDILRNEEEYKQIQAKYVESRREVSQLENSLQECQGQVSTLTYKDQTLEQELSFLKQDNERLAGELTTKATDFSTYRKEKVHLWLVRLIPSPHRFRNCNLNWKRFRQSPILLQNKTGR